MEGLIMNKAIFTAVLAVVLAATLFATVGTRTDTSKDLPIRIAGCINGACS